MAEQLITRDEVIRAGACADGVYEWADRHAPNATAIPVELALRLCSDRVRHYVERAAGLNGYGDGNGNGDGYGNGDCYGDGYGNGDGDGNGYGGGYGGNGDGDGNGYGGGGAKL